MSDYDRKQWQEEQTARDDALTKQREKWAKAKARAAKNAKRKLERLKLKLSESGELSDWEEEFSESVTERLEKFGSAFHDPQLGRPADALSFAQKKVVAALNKKAKQDKQSVQDNDGEELSSEREKPKSSFKSKGGFKSKNAYTPRVRHLEDDIVEDDIPEIDDEPYLPEYKVPEAFSAPKKPFLRIVK